jgi:hypothetical protein
MFDKVKTISLLQVGGALFVVMGVIRLITANLWNGAIWLLLGISLLTYKFPLDRDGMIQFDRRSLVAYLSGAAAVGLMLLYVVTR